MKLLIASDIHGSAKYCGMLLNAYKREKADRLILLGDILYHGPRNDLPREYDPKRVIAMLNPLRDIITAVRGNCEAEVDQMVLDFDVMKTFRETDVSGMHLVLTHGHHYNKERPFPYSGRYVLLNGHFHVPEITDMGGYLYVNCGSVSIPKESSPHSYLMLEGRKFTLKDVISGMPFGSMRLAEVSVMPAGAPFQEFRMST